MGWHVPSLKLHLQALPGRLVPLGRSRVPPASVKPHRYAPSDRGRLSSVLGYISLTPAGRAERQTQLAHERCQLENRNLSSDEVNGRGEDVGKILGRLP